MVASDMLQYKHDIIIFCKSYHKDVERVRVLIDSLKKHNKDNIPFYLLIPRSDENIFKQTLGSDDYELMFEEDVSRLLNVQSHFSQQLYKMEFYRTKIAKYYFTLDSDMYFIKDFHINDFINEDGIPYVTIHENKILRELSYAIMGDNKINEWFVGEREQVQEIFGRKGKAYDYSGSAILYISEVFESLYEEYCKVNNLTFLDLLNYKSSENTWYGEWLLQMGFKFYPCEPMFKSFHYPLQYQLLKQLGITEEHLSKIYLGVTMQSNWGAPLRY